MSEFWLRKMKTYFRIHDFDNDGYISEDDFGEIGRKIADNCKASPEKKEELIGYWRKWWRYMMKDEDLKKNNRLTLPILIKSIGQQLYDPDVVSVISKKIHGMFVLLDVNEDGFLQPEEHQKWYEHMGFPEEAFDRRAAFNAIDTNHDNKLSIDELNTAFLDFMFSQDEGNANNLFFGPLVD